MLFSDLYKIMVKKGFEKKAFVGFRGAIAPRGSAPARCLTQPLLSDETHEPMSCKNHETISCEKYESLSFENYKSLSCENDALCHEKLMTCSNVFF